MPSSKKVIGRRVNDTIDEALISGLEILIPFLHKLEIVPKSINAENVKENDLRELADHWNLSLYDKKSGHLLTFSELIKSLTSMASRIAIRRAEERFYIIIN